MTNEPSNLAPHAPSNATYEAPQIESVLEAADLEREVAYAGVVSISPNQVA